MSIAYLYASGKGSTGVLQKKSVSPSKSVQLVKPGYGYDGLESVTVEAIPDRYTDSSDANATADDIVGGKIAYSSGGRIVGNIVKREPISEKLSVNSTECAIPSGYYAEGGRVYAELEERRITPLGTEQTITPSDGKLISRVIVDAVNTPYVLFNNGILSIL